MKTLTVLSCLSVGLIAAAACGGESSSSSGSKDGEPGAEAGAPASPSEAGAAGSVDGAEPGGAGGETASAGEGGAVSAGGSPAGGRTAGGASPGGASTGGASTGGTSDMEPIPVPEGCDAENQSHGSGSCSLGLSCGSDSISLFCNEGAGDTWKCYCKGDVEQTHDLQSPTSAAACAAAGALCAGKGPGVGEPPERCMPTETSDSTSCSRQDTCERTIELDDGVAVLVEETRQVSCSENGAGSVSCVCGSSEPSAEPTLLDVEAADACGPALSLCQSTRWVHAGKRTCEPESLHVSPGSCALTQVCNQPIETDDGTIVSLLVGEFVDCSDVVEGRARCGCTNDAGTFTFEFDAASSSATCMQAADVCGRLDELETGAAVTCATQTQNVQGTSCDTSLDCSQSGSLGDVEIARHLPLQVICSESDDGWGCACSSADLNVDLTVEAADAWGACTGAAQACPETLGVF